MFTRKDFIDIIAINRRLNVNKIKKGMLGQNTTCLSFLDDVSRLVGIPQGFTVKNESYLFWIQGTDLVRYFVLSFNSHSGEYEGIKTICCNRRENGSSKLTRKEYAEIRTNEINTAIDKFVFKALRTGYMK